MDEWDAYFWPNSNVLKNKVDLTHAASLRSFEYEATRQRAAQLRARPLEGRFDTAHYRAIHRHLFQDVYEWAGQFRKVEFSKGNSAFAPLKTPTYTLEPVAMLTLADGAFRRDRPKIPAASLVVQVAGCKGSAVPSAFRTRHADPGVHGQ
jgi:hypothetical protein